MLDLKDTTLIIPVMVESEDRWTNVSTNLRYVKRHLSTNVIVKERHPHGVSRLQELCAELDGDGLSITYMREDGDVEGSLFHRTRILNEMLSAVVTPVVVNYDCDVVLTPDNYAWCQAECMSGVDLVYPYYWGQSQVQIYYGGRDILAETLDLSLVPADVTNRERSEYGHLQFFRTDSYRKGGMENENFMSYGPEDQERGYRFKRLGYSVKWGNGLVHHLEHTRGVNSSTANPATEENERLFGRIRSMGTDELREYYNNVNYLEKYK